MCLMNFGIVPRLWWPLSSFIRACRAKGHRSNHFRRPGSFRLCYAVRIVQRVLGYWQKMSAPNGPNGPQNWSLQSKDCRSPADSVPPPGIPISTGSNGAKALPTAQTTAGRVGCRTMGTTGSANGFDMPMNMWSGDELWSKNWVPQNPSFETSFYKLQGYWVFVWDKQMQSIGNSAISGQS